tara:strand:- start:142052 stop:142243 length:192 start_codon:yes stop_codon:yes gene_type:complete
MVHAVVKRNSTNADRNLNLSVAALVFFIWVLSLVIHLFEFLIYGVADHGCGQFIEKVAQATSI